LHTVRHLFKPVQKTIIKKSSKDVNQFITINLKGLLILLTFKNLSWLYDNLFDYMLCQENINVAKMCKILYKIYNSLRNLTTISNGFFLNLLIAIKNLNVFPLNLRLIKSIY